MGNCCPQQTGQNNNNKFQKKKNKTLACNISKEQIRQIRIENFEKEFNLASESPQRNHTISKTNQQTEKCDLLYPEANFLKNDEFNEIQTKSDLREISQCSKIIKSDKLFQIKNDSYQSFQEENISLERDQDKSYDLEIQEKINFLLQPCILFNDLVSMQSKEFQKKMLNIKEVSLKNSQILKDCNINYQNMFQKNQTSSDKKYYIELLKEYQQSFSNQFSQKIQIIKISYDQVFQVFKFSYQIQENRNFYEIEQDYYLDKSIFEIQSYNSQITSSNPLFEAFGCKILQIDQKESTIYKEMLFSNVTQISKVFNQSKILWKQIDIESLLLFCLQLIISLYEQQLTLPNFSIQQIGVVTDTSQQFYIFKINGIENLIGQDQLIQKQNIASTKEMTDESYLFKQIKNSCKNIIKIIEENLQIILKKQDVTADLKCKYQKTYDFCQFFIGRSFEQLIDFNSKFLIQKIEDYFPNRFQQVQILSKSIILDQSLKESKINLKNSQSEMFNSQQNFNNMKQESQIQKLLQAVNIVQESIFFIVIKKHIYEFTTELELVQSIEVIEVLAQQLGNSQYEQELFFWVLFNYLQILIVNKIEIESCKRFILQLLNSQFITSNKIGLHYLIDILIFTLIQEQKYEEALNYLEIIIGIIKEGDNLDSLDFKKQIILIKFMIYIFQQQPISTIQTQYSKFQKVQQLIEGQLQVSQLNSLNLMIRLQAIEFLIYLINDQTYQILTKNQQHEQNQSNVMIFFEKIYPFSDRYKISQWFLSLFAYLEVENLEESSNIINKIKKQISQINNTNDYLLKKYFLVSLETIYYQKLNSLDQQLQISINKLIILKERITFNKREDEILYEQNLFQKFYKWIEENSNLIAIKLKEQNIFSLDDYPKMKKQIQSANIQNEDIQIIKESQDSMISQNHKFNELVGELLQMDFYIIFEPFGLMKNRSNIIRKQEFQMNQSLPGQYTKYSKSNSEMQVFQKFYSKLQKKKIDYMIEDKIDKFKYDIYITNTYQIVDFEYYIKIYNYQDVLLGTTYGECVYSNLYLFKNHLSAIQYLNGHSSFYNYIPYTYFIDHKNWSLFTEGGAFNLNEMRVCFQSSQNKISEELFTYTLSKLLSFAIILNKNNLYYGNYSLDTISFFKQNSLYTLKINNCGCISGDYNTYFEIKTLYKFQKYCQIDFGKLTQEQVLFAEVFNICMVVADLIIDDDRDFANLYQQIKQNSREQQQQSFQVEHQNQQNFQEERQQQYNFELVYTEFIQTIIQKLQNEKEYYKNNLIDFIIEIINMRSESYKTSFQMHQLEGMLRQYDLIDQIEGQKHFKNDIEINEQLTTYIFQTTRFYQNQQYKINFQRCFTNYYLNYFSNKKIYSDFFLKALQLNLTDVQSRFILSKLFVIQQYVCSLILNNPICSVDQSFLEIFFQVSIKLFNTINQNLNNDNQRLKLLQEKLGPFQKMGSDVLIEYNYSLLINIALQLNQYSLLKQLIFFDGNSEQFEKDIKELSIKITVYILNNEIEEASNVFNQVNELIGKKLNIKQPIDIAYLLPLLFFSNSITSNVQFTMFYFDQYQKFNQRLLSNQQIVNQDQYFYKIIFLMDYSKILYLLTFNKFEEALKAIQITKQLYKTFPIYIYREFSVQYYISITQLEVLCRSNLKQQINFQVTELIRLKDFMSHEQKSESYPLLFEKIFQQLNGYMLPIIQLVCNEMNEELSLDEQYNFSKNFTDDRNNFDFNFSNLTLGEQTLQSDNQNEDFQRKEEINLTNNQKYLIDSSKNQLLFQEDQNQRDSTQVERFKNQETLTYASFHKYVKKLSNQIEKQEIIDCSQETTQDNQSSSQNTIDVYSQYKLIFQNSSNLKEINTISKDQETLLSNKYFKELNEQQVLKYQNSKYENRGSQSEQKQVLQSLYDNNLDKQNLDLPKNNYKLVKIGELGRGGFGSVSIYYDNETRNKIAIKQFNNLKEYQQEKNILQYIQYQEQFFEVNKYTCQLIDYNDYNYQLALEIGFTTLQEAAQILNIQETGFSIPNLINFLNSMVCFCIELHKIKYYHGDIKPQNIIITVNQNSSDFQQNFGICQIAEANIRFIDFGSFSNDVDCYYDYISAKYKCLFFEEIIEQQKLTWEQVLFAEIYSCCKTIIHSMSQDLYNEYVLFNKSQADYQNPNQSQKLKLFDFLDIFLTQDPSQNNILKYGITLSELIQIQQQYLIQNQEVLVQNYYQIDLIQKQLWKKIQTDDYVESQINNQFQQNMLRACSFRNKILNNKQSTLTPNQLREYSLKDILDNLFLLVFYFDLNPEEYKIIKEINDFIQNQDKYTQYEKFSFSLEICCFFQMYQQDSQELNIFQQLRDQYFKLQQELNQLQQQIYEQLIINQDSKFTQLQEQIFFDMMSNQFQQNIFLDIFLIYCSFSNLRENRQELDQQARYPYRSQLIDWFNKNKNNLSIYKKNVFYYCLIVIDIVVLQNYEDTLSIYQKLRQNAKMINKKIEAEIIFLIQFSLLKQNKQTDFASLSNSLAILRQANYKSQLNFYFKNIFQDFVKQNLSIIKQEFEFKSIMDTIF
ncbi:hypothetical protein ABPG74_000254 [Tetrahymena malaccensis]